MAQLLHYCSYERVNRLFRNGFPDDIGHQEKINLFLMGK